MGTRQADLIESVLPQLFPTPSVLVHARSRHRRLERLRVSSIQQSLGGGGCRFRLSRCARTDSTSTDCNRCCSFVSSSSGARGSRRLDFEPQRFGRGSICTSWFSGISKIPRARCIYLVSRLAAAVSPRVIGKTLSCRFPGRVTRP